MTLENQLSETFHPLRESLFPTHLGIIPDGGRRWAKSNETSYIESYRLSMRKLTEIADLLYLEGIETISVYFSSIQNFRRTSDEIYSFCKAEAEFIQKYIENCKKIEIRLSAVGQKNILPDYLYKIITQAEKITEKFNRKTLYLCVAYDPFYEIREVLKNSNGSFTCNDLLVNKPLNLVIRSGGANLFSNFLPLQSGFARLYVSNKLFNDMTYSDFMRFINQYMGIEQIYGE